MFHLAAFSESQDSAVLTNIAALADQALQINGDDLIVPNDIPMLLGAYGLGPNLTRVQIISPSIRRTFPQEHVPIDVSALPTDRLLVDWYGDSAIQLDSGEQLNTQMAESNAAASRGTVFVWLGDRVPSPQYGDIRTIRVTSTTAAVANVWSNIPITFNDVLPSGTYALVGAELISTNMQGFRFAFKGGSYRPGGIGGTAVSARPNPLFRRGGLGVWGTFENLTPPSVDVLCNGADASFAGELDVVYLGR